MATDCRYDSPEPDQWRSTQPKQNKKLIVYPLVRQESGEYSIPHEYMAQIWLRIKKENRHNDLFYDGSVTDLQGWLNYIYNPQNHVIVIADETGYPSHIAWINKFYQGHAFLHHCAIGQYNRRSWPLIRDHWAGMKDDFGNSLIKVLLGITPVTNKLAIKLVKILKWNMLGCVPFVCFLAFENRHVAGMVSYFVLNEV